MVKRFIAGAVCPRCGKMDKIVSYTEGDDLIKACVACDFKEVMGQDGALQELPTRVNQADKFVREDAETVIKIIK